MDLKGKAEEIMGILNNLPQVKSCKIYGSISNGSTDELSDIDIEVDVSGTDNGQFMLELIDKIKDKIEIVYSDFAPSLIPRYYVVSAVIDKTNPFSIVDFRCVANPHFSTVTNKQAKNLNNVFSHILKLWTINLKHYVRGKDCYDDIVYMANKLDIDTCNKTGQEILKSTLLWLEENADDKFIDFIETCKIYYEKLINNFNKK